MISSTTIKKIGQTVDVDRASRRMGQTTRSGAAAHGNYRLGLRSKLFDPPAERERSAVREAAKLEADATSVGTIFRYGPLENEHHRTELAPGCPVEQGEEGCPTLHRKLGVNQIDPR